MSVLGQLLINFTHYCIRLILVAQKLLFFFKFFPNFQKVLISIHQRFERENSLGTLGFLPKNADSYQG